MVVVAIVALTAVAALRPLLLRMTFSSLHSLISMVPFPFSVKISTTTACFNARPGRSKASSMPTVVVLAGDVALPPIPRLANAVQSSVKLAPPLLIRSA